MMYFSEFSSYGAQPNDHFFFSGENVLLKHTMLARLQARYRLKINRNPAPGIFTVPERNLYLLTEPVRLARAGMAVVMGKNMTKAYRELGYVEVRFGVLFDNQLIKLAEQTANDTLGLGLHKSAVEQLCANFDFELESILNMLQLAYYGGNTVLPLTYTPKPDDQLVELFIKRDKRFLVGLTEANASSITTRLFNYLVKLDMLAEGSGWYWERQQSHKELIEKYIPKCLSSLSKLLDKANPNLYIVLGLQLLFLSIVEEEMFDHHRK